MARPTRRPGPVVEVENLVKVYGPVRAVDGISFTVEKGEVFGLVGPNGAGKTTTVECLLGLRHPTSGRLAVLGLDPHKDARALRELIGAQLQSATLPGRMRVREALHLFAGLYRKRVEPLDALLHRVGLEGKAHLYFEALSGGEKQRLFIALALVNDPEVVFLDELTTGLDPRGRRQIWSLIETLKLEGKTVLLTSHFMEEVQRLADRVAVLSGGRILALGTPQELIARYGGTPRLVLHLRPGQNPGGLPAHRPWEIWREGEAVKAILKVGDAREAAWAIHELVEKGVEFQALELQQPDLEDVYLNLTGKPMEGEA